MAQMNAQNEPIVLRKHEKHFIKMASVSEKLIHHHVLSTVCLSNVFIINSADEQLITSRAWITFL